MPKSALDDFCISVEESDLSDCRESDLIAILIIFGQAIATWSWVHNLSFVLSISHGWLPSNAKFLREGRADKIRFSPSSL